MAENSQPAPAGLTVNIGLEQVGMELILNLQFGDGSLSSVARMRMQGAEALHSALGMAIDKARSTIIKPAGLILEN